MPPANSSIAKLDFEEARELAHFGAISHDLGFVVEATDKLAELLRSSCNDQILLRSIYAAALIAYIRCFTSGRRSSLSPEIFDSLSGDAFGWHDYFKNTRNKHIAHAVNAFEEVFVGAVLSPPNSGERTVEGVAWFVINRLTDCCEGVEWLAKLAGHARKQVAERCKDLEKRVLNKASRLAIESLYESPNLGLTVQMGSDVARTPRKF